MKQEDREEERKIRKTGMEEGQRIGSKGREKGKKWERKRG